MNIDHKTNYTDNQLLELLRKDNKEAFTELYNRYWDKTFAMAVNRLSDENDAEEVVQEIFLSIWQRRRTLKLSYTMSTYLSVAVKYQILNQLARQHRKRRHIDYIALNAVESENSTINWLFEKELKQQIENGIDTLPEKCRIVFLLSREQGKSGSQIADELNISEKTVEAHITKALRTLRKTVKVLLPLLISFCK